MKHVRYKHIITKIETVDDATHTHDLVFPSINQAKRYNRTKLAGQAKVVARKPKVGAIHNIDNMTCKE